MSQPDQARRQYLTSAEVAAMRRIKEASLQQERWRKEGPPYVKDRGRVLYPLDLLEAWLDERLHVHST